MMARFISSANHLERDCDSGEAWRFALPPHIEQFVSFALAAMRRLCRHRRPMHPRDELSELGLRDGRI